MRVVVVALILILASALLAAPAVTAHAGGCTVAVHAYGNEVHQDCGHGNRPCFIDIRDPLLSVHVACGTGENGNCPLGLRIKSMKIEACMPHF